MGTGQALKDGRGTEYSTANESKLIGYFGRLNYNYDDRYLLTATLRADGSSSFAKESRWGWFPSVALAWKVNNEAFLKDVEAINSLKLRLGWQPMGRFLCLWRHHGFGSLHLGHWFLCRQLS